jgi:hypothetical protein
MFGEATNTLISTKLVDDKNQVVQSGSQMVMLEDLTSTHDKRLGWGRLGIVLWALTVQIISTSLNNFEMRNRSRSSWSRPAVLMYSATSSSSAPRRPHIGRLYCTPSSEAMSATRTMAVCARSSGSSDAISSSLDDREQVCRCQTRLDGAELAGETPEKLPLYHPA